MLKSIAVFFCILIFGILSVIILGSIAPQEATNQFVLASLGMGAFLVASQIPRQIWPLAVPPLYLLIILLLGITLWRGHLAKGAVRWLPIGPVRVQVSEPAKPLLALTLALYCKSSIKSQKRLLGALVLIAIPFFSVFLQPDLGSALVLGAVGGGALLASISNKKLLLPWIVLAIISILISWQFFLYPYQKNRVLSFIGQGSLADSYNAKQALIAVGSGKLFGRGIGHGVQSNLRFLPEFHTDFFFASYAEEVGFVGVILLLLLYAFFLFLLLHGIDDLEPVSKIYRYAYASGVLFQLSVHIAMNIGLSPVTGIPLPFLSSGGSSFVSLAFGAGLALALSTKKVVIKQQRVKSIWVANY